MSAIITNLCIGVLKTYQSVISPLFPASCRFYPSCSAYAIEAFKRFPWPKASLLSIKRIGRCHPWHRGGYDPVPHPEDTGNQHG